MEKFQEPQATIKTNAQILAEAAQAQAQLMNSTGSCAKAFNDMSIQMGIATERGHAYQKIAQLQSNSNFQEVTGQYKSAQDLKNLPPGYVVVWDKSAEKPYGHISTSLGGGLEASDHIQKQTLGTDKAGRAYGAYHVFAPVEGKQFNQVSSLVPSGSPKVSVRPAPTSQPITEQAVAEQAIAEASVSNEPQTEMGSFAAKIAGKALNLANITAGQSVGAVAAGLAREVGEIERQVFGNSVPLTLAELGTTPEGEEVRSNLGMITGFEKNFEPIQAEATVEPTEEATPVEVETAPEAIESPMPDMMASYKRQDELEAMNAQRPVNVIVPQTQTNNEASLSGETPTIADAAIDDIRLLAINQGLC